MNTNQEIEKQLIGMAIVYRDCYQRVAPMLIADSFTDPLAAKTWNCMQHLEEQGLQPDMPGLLSIGRTLYPDGERSELLRYWQEAVRGCASCRNLLPLAYAIADEAQRRQISGIASDMSRTLQEGTLSTDDIIAEADRRLLDLQQESAVSQPLLIGDVMQQTLSFINAHRQSGSAITGIPTGYRQLDEATLGLQPSDLIIIAARPSCGKTTLGLNIALRMAKQGFPVAFFSIEMGAQQIAMKCLSAHCHIHHYKLRAAKLSDEELRFLEQSAVSSQQEADEGSDNRSLPQGNEKRGLPLYLVDRSTLTVAELRRLARNLVHDKGVRCIFVDYLQLIRPAATDSRYRNREQEVSQISQGLKAIAKELDIPVVALAQMNRAVEQRRQEGSRPQLSDLRESGAIEQDADIVCFIHKMMEGEAISGQLSAVSGSPQGEQSALSEEQRGKGTLVALIIAKHRNGLCTDLLFDFEGEYSTFSEHQASIPDSYHPAYDKIFEQ